MKSSLLKACQSFVFPAVVALLLFLASNDHPPVVHAATCNYHTLCHGVSKLRGLDTCSAPNTSVMSAWWNSSPYYDMGIYIGGSNRSCDQPNLTSSWIQTSHTYGWDFYLTWAGPASQCINSGSAKTYISSDLNTAYQQGVGEAANAQQAASTLGLQGYSVIYYDLESYSTNITCRNSAKSFLNGWDYMMSLSGILSGVYGSPCNAGDWTTIVYVPNYVWLADWNYDPDVWGLACGLPNGLWAYNQRIHQWDHDLDQTWGGYQLRIDLDCADGEVAPAGHASENPLCTVE